MKSPILFIIFNRPEVTKLAFEKIRQARPSRLYIAADGPRNNRLDDFVKCKQTRSIADCVDWPCEIHKLFRDENLGCGRGVSSAITWFFEHEEEGIIIEDDIVPHIDFFKYCDEMLDKYRNDSRIQLIAGRNPFYNGCQSNVSYYMSSYFAIWGWATWRRVWDTYEFETRKLDKKQFLDKLSKIITRSSYKFYKIIYNLMYDHKIDTWDYQFYFNQIIYDRYSIIPYTNMTENIGLGIEDSTHTLVKDDIKSNHKAKSPYPLIHPDEVKPDLAADKLYRINNRVYIRPLYQRIIGRIKRLL